MPTEPPIMTDVTSSRSSRRGRDASHLLNFHPLPHRADPHCNEGRAEEQPPVRRQPGGAATSRNHYESKVAYRAAKVHLLVAPGRDYRAQRLDPDVPIDWDAVRAVRYATTESIRCPICLIEPPLAPQIYGCAHILCLPCALRYQAACDDAGSACRCPLCAEAVSLDEMRAVVITTNQPVVAGGAPTAFAKLCLQSAEGASGPSSAATVVSTVAEALSSQPRLLGFTEVLSFDSLLNNQHDEVVVAIRTAEEAAEAVAAVQEDKKLASGCSGASGVGGDSTATVAGGPGRPRTAADVLRQGLGGGGTRGGGRTLDQRASGGGLAASEQVLTDGMTDDTAEELAFLRLATEAIHECRVRWAADDAALQPSPSTTSPALPVTVSSPGLPPATASEELGGRLALQAADGQLVFGDALSCRLLLDEYGSWAACPDKVVVPILELATFRLSDGATRKRFKMLSHLPQAATFQVAELDVSALVSPRVLAGASEMLARRAARRRLREAEEAKAAKAASARERENAKLASKHGRSALAVELELASVDVLEAARRRQSLAADAPVIQVGAEWQVRWQAEQQLQMARQAPSFARMVHKGFAASGPALSTSPTSPTSGRPSRSPELSPSCSPLGPTPSNSSTPRPGPLPRPSPPSSLGSMLPPASPATRRASDGSLFQHVGADASRDCRMPVPVPVVGFSALRLGAQEAAEEESVPPPLAATWAVAAHTPSQMESPCESSSSTGGRGGRKGSLKQQVTLISNTGIHRRS